MPASLDIEVQRNGDYYAGWTFRDPKTKEPLDMTGWTLRLQVKPIAGYDGPPIASATFHNRDDAAGYVEVQLQGSPMRNLPGKTEIVRLAYDFLAIDELGVRVIQTRGHIILMPGVTL